MKPADTIIFDQYSRYRSCAELLAAAGQRGDRVLDVGSGPQCLLGRFLPDRRITYLDPLISFDQRDDVLACQLDQVDLSARRFDFVVTVDTLEHVKPDQRETFIGRLSKLATKGLIIAGPFDGAQANAVDAWVNDVYKLKKGANYPWLDEHLRYGLPNRDRVRHQLDGDRWHTRVYGNGHTPWLRTLLAMTICLLDDATGPDLVARISRLCDRQLFPFDHFEPVYRHLVVGLKDDACGRPHWLADTAAHRQAASAAWDQVLGQVIGQLGRGFANLAHESVASAQARSTLKRALVEARASLAAVQSGRQLAAQRAEAAWDQVKALSSQVQAKRAAAEAAQLQCQAAIAECATLKLQLHELRDQLQSQRRQLAAGQARSQLRSLQRTWKKTRSSLKTTRELLAATRGKLQDALADQQTAGRQLRQLELARRKLVSAEVASETRSAQMQMLRGHWDQAVTELHHSRGELEAAQQQIRRARRDLLETRRQLHAAVNGQRAAREALDRTRLNLDDSFRKIGRWREALAHRDRRRQRLRHELNLVYTSRSWRWTGPLRKAGLLARRCRQLARTNVATVLELTGKRLYRWLPLPETVRWRLTCAFFLCFGRLLRQTHAWAAYQQERSWRRQAAVVRPTTERLASGASSGGPDRPARQGQDMLIWGVIDWHFRIQRPQQLARQWASQDHRIFYLSPQFIDRPEPGFAHERIDGDGVIYNIRLHARGRPVIYEGQPPDPVARQIAASVGKVLQWAQIRSSVSIVDHPSWGALALAVPDGTVCYDCMDHHGGFDNAGATVDQLEQHLVERADMVVTTSRWLHERFARHSIANVLVRNGCQYEHFARRPQEVYTDRRGRRIIGYYGAIAEWFDVELIRATARRFADCLILLVGSDTAGVAEQLSDCTNVEALGEVAYDKLPCFLHAMDVCLIPFRRNSLTMATNPVKVYEYLSAGKPVVATALPELAEAPLDRLVYRGDSAASFLHEVRRGLDENPSGSLVNQRRRFARAQGWVDRAREVQAALGAIGHPKVSVVVVTWNNLALTRRCLDSVLKHAGSVPHELIVVDNASSDATPAYLRDLARSHDQIKAICNDQNRGFAAASNQGLDAAGGDYLVLLNNDTVVIPGSMRTLMNHLRRDSAIGLIGPVTNNIGNEARVPVAYSDMDQMETEAFALTRSRLGRTFDIPVLAFFCAMMRRSLRARVGPLDERFGTGFFEDDDYCRRVRAVGKRIVCAEDVFVHHDLGGSFNMISQAKKDALFAANKAYFESKWGPWQAHRYRKPVVVSS